MSGNGKLPFHQAVMHNSSGSLSQKSLLPFFVHILLFFIMYTNIHIPPQNSQLIPWQRQISFHSKHMLCGDNYWKLSLVKKFIPLLLGECLDLSFQLYVVVSSTGYRAYSANLHAATLPCSLTRLTTSNTASSDWYQGDGLNIVFH